jgi:hypothetical protein
LTRSPFPILSYNHEKVFATVHRGGWIAAFCALAAYGQATQGLISGRVVNSQTGAPLPGAAISYQAAAIGNSGAARSGPDGYYALPLLPPAQYRIRVAADDFQPQEVYELEVPVAGRIDLDFRLRPLSDVWEAGQYRSVFLPGSKAVVTFYGPDVDTSRSAFVESARGTRGALESTVSDVIDPAQVRDLPLAGRDVYTVLVTQPGATADAATARGLGLAVNGQRPSASNFLLDGVENNNYLVTGPATAVAPEAVQEYRVSTANFTAEYGRASGFVANAVTRAGANDWHGTGYFYFKNDVLNANSFQQNLAGIRRTPIKEAQPGYQAGGRVLRDRLFVSSALEDFRSRGRGEPVTFQMPTTTLRDFTAPNSAARRLLDQYASALPVNARRLSVPVEFEPPTSIDRLLALERADALLKGGAHRIFGRLAISRLERPDFVWYPYADFTSPLTDNGWNLALSLQSTLRPAVVNEFRMARVTGDLRWDRPHPEVPTLFTGDDTLLPGSPLLYAYRNQSRHWEFVDNLTWIRGRHIVKAGGAVLLRNVQGELTAGRDGLYAFDSALDFALDRPVFFSAAVSRTALPRRAVPDYARQYRNRQFSFFAQDTFRARRRLVFDYGVRYENFGAPVNTGAVKDAVVALGSGGDFRSRMARAQLVQPGSGDQPLYSADGRGWAGRLGFSYSLDRGASTLVRGAYGIFHDRPFDNLWQNVRANDVALPVFLASGGRTDFLAPVATALNQYRDQDVDGSFPSMTLFPGSMKNGYAQSAFLGVQHRAGENWSLEANTLMTLGRRLIATDVVNRRPDQPSLPSVSYRANQGASTYNALTLAARYRSARGQLHLAYTWSHTLDNQSEPLAGDFFDLSFSRVSSGSSRPLVAAFQRELDSRGDRGNSDFDQRQNLVVYSVWNLPGRILRGWKVAEMAAFRTGFPYSVFVGSSRLPDGTVYLNRRASVKTADPARDALSAGGRQMLDPAAFFDPAGGVPGNTGRNAFRGPGLFNVDLSLSRTFALPRLRERARLTVRADAFNFLNHANLNSPDPFLDSPTFGKGLYGRTGRDAGFPAVSPFTETARQIQLLLRLEF